MNSLKQKLEAILADAEILKKHSADVSLASRRFGKIYSLKVVQEHHAMAKALLIAVNYVKCEHAPPRLEECGRCRILAEMEKCFCE